MQTRNFGLKKKRKHFYHLGLLDIKAMWGNFDILATWGKFDIQVDSVFITLIKL